jgi:hypothetical protein
MSAKAGILEFEGMKSLEILKDFLFQYVIIFTKLKEIYLTFFMLVK